MSTPPPPKPADAVLTALLERYFALLSKERIGLTPEISTEADQLEAAIRKRKTELAHED